LVTNHAAAFARFVPAHFELRLDHGQHARAGVEPAADRGQQLFQADERSIDHHQVQAIGERVARDVARVRAIHDHHARVVRELVRELAVADVDRVHLARAALQ